MKIGTIVEGPTDRLLLKAIIDHIYPDEHEYRDLQPIDIGSSFGERGTGWKGVQRFCFDIRQQLNTNLADFVKDNEFDLLVIHIDADIAIESDLQDKLANPIADVQQPCPPISQTVRNLREIVAQWLSLRNTSEFPEQIILAIPAQDSETWLFAGLYPDDPLCTRPDYECIHPINSKQHPAYLLSLKQYGRILKRKDGKLKKSKRKYETKIPDILLVWNRVCDICSQAKAFNDALENI